MGTCKTLVMGNSNAQESSAKTDVVSTAVTATLPYEPLPSLPDPALAQAYSCDVLHTTKGLLKGTWGRFEATNFFRPLPGDAVQLIRHILVFALELTRYAEREGEVIAVDTLGEGSYANVYGLSNVAAKIISDRERQWVHKAAVANSLQADRSEIGPRIFGHGRVEQSLGGHFSGTVILMERLDALGDAWSDADTSALLGNISKLSRVGFHNDLKLPNVLRRQGVPVMIDFDLMETWKVKVAVTSSCIEHSFQELLEAQGHTVTDQFREYYDLFAFSLTLQDGSLYRAVLKRLQDLWSTLEQPVLRPLVETVSEEKMTEVPFEVLIRVPLRGVTVNILDLRGNLFVHLDKDDSEQLTEGALPKECERFPQLFKSNGVYWP